jgi:hypothetical protein
MELLGRKFQDQQVTAIQPCAIAIHRPQCHKNVTRTRAQGPKPSARCICQSDPQSPTLAAMAISGGSTTGAKFLARQGRHCHSAYLDEVTDTISTSVAEAGSADHPGARPRHGRPA